MIADEQLIPHEDNKFYSENLIKLSNVMAFPTLKVKNTLKRVDFSLPQDKIVFANFSSPIMLDEAVFSAWMQILTQVPNSILWLNYASEHVKNNLLAQAKNAGIAANRIFFTKYEPLSNVFLHQLCDIYLDTTLINCDYNIVAALYHAKPVVAVKGESALSRIAHSILTAAQLNINANLDEYISQAVSLATNKQAYKVSTSQLSKISEHSLFKQKEYLKQLEQALKNIVQLKN
jgi:predicted O-linked N-acetylglucosamine transferase (SPINDLY family)